MGDLKAAMQFDAWKEAWLPEDFSNQLLLKYDDLGWLAAKK